MTSDYFGGFVSRMTNEPAWPVHDRVMGVQAAVLSQLMNPTTLRRVYDNEFRVPSDQDAVTLNEILNKVSVAIWSEINEAPKGKFTERNPAISSLRRNLQTEHMQRLFDLGSEKRGGSAAMKPIANLASLQLAELNEKLQKAVKNDNYDAYTKAHLVDAQTRIQKWLDAQYVISAN
jgi:hypothetical protein